MREKEQDSKPFLRLLTYMKPYWLSAVIAIFFLTLSVGGELATPILMGKIIDVIKPASKEGNRVANQPNASDLVQKVESNDSKEMKLHQLKHSSLILLAIMVFAFFAMIFQIYLTGMMGQNIMRDMRLEALKKTQKLSLHYLNNTAKGSIISRITNDIETINEFVNILSNQIIKNIEMMILSITFMMLLNWQLGLITLLTFLPILLLIYFFRKMARKAYRLVRKTTSDVNAFLSEHISALSVVKIFNKEKWSQEEFEKKNSSLLKALLKEIRVFSIFRPLTNMFGSISIALIIQVSGILKIMDAQWISAGLLFSFIQLAQFFYRPVLELAENFGIIQSALAGSERVFELLDNNEFIADKNSVTGENQPQGEAIKGKIDFNKVSFEYKRDNPILKELSIHIQPGEKVAIVGPTGSGKSTIANLITRLWDINEGEIFIDDVDIKQYSLNQLRNQIITVQQDIFLFSGTIRDNITLGSKLSDQALIKAAKTVNAHSFISRLPLGYETEILENGGNFSTGEKQLITFARAIAHNPSVIILDEATSNVDTESEQLIQEAMKKLFKGRTTIVIAHRLSTIMDADRILVLVNGKIIEEGNHQSLMKKEGPYFHLCQLQFH